MGPLDSLLQLDKRTDLHLIATTDALYRVLASSDEVAKAVKQLGTGQLSDDGFVVFVDDLLGSFERGVRFPHQYALAGLAIVASTRKTPTTENLLDTLAKSQASEISVSSRIARYAVGKQSQGREQTLVVRADGPKIRSKDLYRAQSMPVTVFGPNEQPFLKNIGWISHAKA